LQEKKKAEDEQRAAAQLAYEQTPIIVVPTADAPIAIGNAKQFLEAACWSPLSDDVAPDEFYINVKCFVFFKLIHCCCCCCSTFVCIDTTFSTLFCFAA
jgi:hypothetical protein